jgi:hypothetical protein
MTWVCAGPLTIGRLVERPPYRPSANHGSGFEDVANLRGGFAEARLNGF